MKLSERFSEPVVELHGDRLASIYDRAVLCADAEQLLEFRCSGYRIRFLGDGLTVAAVSAARTVVRGRIREICVEK